MAEADSSYIFYADESGDHSLTSIDVNFPVFALSLCGFKKSSYCSQIVPRFQRIKFHYFGHDAVILHEHEIRKQKGALIRGCAKACCKMCRTASRLRPSGSPGAPS